MTVFSPSSAWVIRARPRSVYMAIGLRKYGRAVVPEELPVNGDQLRQTWFWPVRFDQKGYGARDVDDLVNRVAVELDAGRPAGR